jgi:hypothetical protein
MNSKPMFSRRPIGVALAALSVGIIGLALLSPDSSLQSRLPFVDAPIENSLSGRVGSDGPILVVKIDDTRPAHPQVGLEDADIVYIEQVEGGLTRLAALFSSKIPVRVGPVRSARISDMELLEQFGPVGFAYSGAQSKLRPVIADSNLIDLGAPTHSPTIYTTDPARYSPYAMVLRADLLMELVKERNQVLAESKSPGWDFGDAPDGGVRIDSATISWPANSYTANWSEEKNGWLLDHGGYPNILENGQRVTASTFVIQLVEISDSIYKDKGGGVTPFSKTIGEGAGYILRDGSYFKARWSRPTLSAGTSWTTQSGEEISFAKGQIWVALTDKEPKFSSKAADAPVGEKK